MQSVLWPAWAVSQPPELRLCGAALQRRQQHTAGCRAVAAEVTGQGPWLARGMGLRMLGSGPGSCSSATDVLKMEAAGATA